MKEKFRLAGDIREFFQDLKKLKNEDDSLVIWQTTKSKKQKFQAKFESYQTEKDKIIINLKLDKTQSFEPKKDIFVFAQEKGILFKGVYEFCVASSLKIVADEKIYLKEKRNTDRYNFNYSEIKIDLAHFIAGATANEEVLLKDISIKGMSFLISPNKSLMYQLGSRVEFDSIYGIKLPSMIKGRVVHNTKFKNKISKNNTDNQIIGIEFDQESKIIKKVFDALEATKDTVTYLI